jgi:hypothetical protein
MQVEERIDKAFGSVQTIKDLLSWCSGVRLHISRGELTGVQVNEEKMWKVLEITEGCRDEGLLEVVILGDQFVRMSDEQMKRCFGIKSLMVTNYLILKHRLSDEVVNYCVKLFGEYLTSGLGSHSHSWEMLDLLIRNHGKLLNGKSVDFIQRVGSMHTCLTLWWVGVGYPMMEFMDGKSEQEFRGGWVSKYLGKHDGQVAALDWRVAYLSQVEVGRLKAENVVSAVVRKAVAL